MTSLYPGHRTLDSEEDFEFDSDARSHGRVDISQNPWSRRIRQQPSSHISGISNHSRAHMHLHKQKNKNTKIDHSKYKECISEEIKRDFSTLIISRNRVVYCTKLSKDEENETKSQIFNNDGQLNISNANEDHFELKNDYSNSSNSDNSDSLKRRFSHSSDDSNVSHGTATTQATQATQGRINPYHGIGNVTTDDFEAKLHSSGDGSMVAAPARGGGSSRRDDNDSISVTERNRTMIADLQCTLGTMGSLTDEHYRDRGRDDDDEAADDGDNDAVCVDDPWYKRVKKSKKVEKQEKQEKQAPILNDTDYLDNILKLLQKHVSSFESESKTEDELKDSDCESLIPDLANVDQVQTL